MGSDITVKTAAGEDVLLVEVKARRGRDEKWATQFHRNLRAHGMIGRVPYFLLVTLDQAYLWDEQREDGHVGPPGAVAPTADLVDPELLATAARDGQAMELLVSAWVRSLVGGTQPDDLTSAARALLVESGLFERLRDGAVLTEAA